MTLAGSSHVLTAARPQAVAALLRYFRDLDTAEEAFQEACLRALKAWPKQWPAARRRRLADHGGQECGDRPVRRQRRMQPLPHEELISDLSDAEAELAERIDEADYRDDILRLAVRVLSSGAAGDAADRAGAAHRVGAFGAPDRRALSW